MTANQVLELDNGLVARVLDERPGTGGELHFCLPGKRFRDGMVVSVMAGNHRSWYGMFARGDTSFRALLRGPSAATVIIVSGGGLYVVPVQKPEKYWTIGEGYIEGILVAEQYSMAVAWDPWGIEVFSGTSVSFDVPVGANGFRSMHLVNQFLVGEAYLPERSGFVPFRLNILDGDLRYGTA